MIENYFLGARFDVAPKADFDCFFDLDTHCAEIQNDAVQLPSINLVIHDL